MSGTIHCSPSRVSVVLERNQWTDTSLIGEDFVANLEEETAIVYAIWSDLGY